MKDRGKRVSCVQEGVNQRYQELWGAYKYKQGYLEGVQAFAAHDLDELERAKLDRDMALYRVERFEDTGMRIDEDGNLRVP